MILFVAVFAAALIGALLVTPLARRTALRFDIVDHPGGRKAHAAPMPYLGGLAIYGAFLLFLIGAFLQGKTDTPALQGVAIVAGATLMVSLGLLDDRFDLPPLPKLAGQLIAAGLLYASGVHFHFNHFGAVLDPAVSILWVVGITNAFNLLDNMDGLSVGTAAIGCAYFFLLAELEPHIKQVLVASMAAALCGACLGFLYYNFNPARIFIGDAGALFLGFMMSVLGLKINMNGFPNLHAVNFFVPVVVLGIPIFDTALVTVSRLRRGVPVSRGGRDHTSHRLILLGLTVREAVMTVYLAACALGFAGLLLTIAGFTSGMTVVALLIIAGLAAGYKLEQVYRKTSDISNQMSDVSNQISASGGQHIAAESDTSPLLPGNVTQAASAIAVSKEKLTSDF